MALKPGRPSEGKVEDTPTIYTRTHYDKDGCIQVWHYNHEKYPNNPLWQVEITYPEGYFPDEESTPIDPTSESLPKTKRMYMNPSNNKLVGYTRAKALGLID